MLTATAGANFVAALCTQREIGAAGEDNAEFAIADDAARAPGLTMLQTRQEALLALVRLRGSLTEGGESVWLLYEAVDTREATSWWGGIDTY